MTKQLVWVPEWPPSDERGHPESVRLSSGTQPPRPCHRHGARHAPAPAANDGSSPGLHGDAHPSSTGHGHDVSGPGSGPAQPRFPGQLPTCAGNTSVHHYRHGNPHLSSRPSLVSVLRTMLEICILLFHFLLWITVLDPDPS